MDEHVTLVRPDADTPDSRGSSSVLPPDLLEQVRERVQRLALLFAVVFAFDTLIAAVIWTGTLIGLVHPPPEFYDNLPFQWINLGSLLASLGLWWAARSPRVSSPVLHTFGLVYQIAICFSIAFGTYWFEYLEHARLPNMTWVPAIVIFFPLIVPVRPGRMLGAAIAAAATSPLALLLLERMGKVQAGGEDYFHAVFNAVVAVIFAYAGARVVYRLGREVAAARELGSYRLEQRLGQGGMGEVWSARHRLLARPAAIKLIRRPPGGHATPAVSEAAARRFEREAQVIASLRSPHTVNLFDFGIADDGAFYYVMELLEGLDADTLVRRFGPVPPERVVFLLRQVCHSLSEADSCGLVHRDIKPANIFLCRYGEDYDFVKVLDFGIVKATDETPDGQAVLTRDNAIQGTPAFMAPEQALGEGKVDARADIYATGCVAYWLLTGQLVFTAESGMALVMHHVRTPPVPPSARSGRTIPAALERLVLECLAKDPAHRPQSARELLQRLADIELRTPWSDQQAREWWATHSPAHPAQPVDA